MNKHTPRKKIGVEEQRAQMDNRFLRGKQIAYFDLLNIFDQLDHMLKFKDCRGSARTCFQYPLHDDRIITVREEPQFQRVRDCKCAFSLFPCVFVILECNSLHTELILGLTRTCTFVAWLKSSCGTSLPTLQCCAP